MKNNAKTKTRWNRPETAKYATNTREQTRRKLLMYFYFSFRALNDDP